MAYGTIENTTWPVDTGETTVEWKLRFAPQSLTDRDRELASAILKSYHALTEPAIEEAEAVTLLRRARAVAKAAHASEEEAREDMVRKDYLVVVPGMEEIMGPYSQAEALRVHSEVGGQIRKLVRTP